MDTGQFMDGSFFLSLPLRWHSHWLFPSLSLTLVAPLGKDKNHCNQKRLFIYELYYIWEPVTFGSQSRIRHILSRRQEFFFFIRCFWTKFTFINFILYTFMFHNIYCVPSQFIAISLKSSACYQKLKLCRTSPRWTRAKSRSSTEENKRHTHTQWETTKTIFFSQVIHTHKRSNLNFSS